METIFDHNPTEREMRQMMCPEEDEPTTTEEEYKRLLASEGVYPELNLGDIYYLYILRGDGEKANKYMDMIQDEEYKRFVYFSYNMLH